MKKKQNSWLQKPSEQKLKDQIYYSPHWMIGFGIYGMCAAIMGFYPGAYLSMLMMIMVFISQKLDKIRLEIRKMK